MSIKTKTAATIKQLQEAHAKWGHDFYELDFENSRPTPNVEYTSAKFKLADGKTIPAYVSFEGAKIFGCKAPEKRKDNCPSYGMNDDTQTESGEPLGQVVKWIDESRIYQIEARKASNKCDKKFKDSPIKSFRQTIREERDFKGKVITTHELESPISRIKFRQAIDRNDNRKAGDKLPTFNKPISISRNGKFEKTAPDGSPINIYNVHECVKGGSLAYGVINFSEDTLSSQGHANTAANEGLYLKPPSGFGIDLENEFDISALNNLHGAVVENEPVEEGEESSSKMMQSMTVSGDEQSDALFAAANTED